MQTGIETTTIHDWKPTHDAPPAFVVGAKLSARRAWQKVSELSDEYEAGQTDLATCQEAVKAAQDADAWYRDVYAAWKRGDEGAIACSCTPDSTCENCKRQAAANPEGVYAY